MSNAHKEKCCVCGAKAVVFWPVIDPDIPAHPYCRRCVEQQKIATLRAITGHSEKEIARVTKRLRKKPPRQS